MRPLILLLCLITLPLLADESPPPSKLPADAAKLIAKADADIVAIRKTLAAALQKSQEAATKKGDLDGALAVKGKIAEITGQIPAAAKPPAPTEYLAGTFLFTLPDGTTGKMVLKGDKASDLRSGYSGLVTVEAEVTTVRWSNNTSWVITRDGDKLSLSTRDGPAKLEKQ